MGKQVLAQEDYGAAMKVCPQLMDEVIKKGGPFNVYDVRKTCLPSDPLCYNFTAIIDYLALPATREALHVHSNWTLCDGPVYNALQVDWWRDQSFVVPMLLDRYRVQIYSGVEGWIVNHVGSETWMRELNWLHQAE